jgi:hypothetical protein
MELKSKKMKYLNNMYNMTLRLFLSANYGRN